MKRILMLQILWFFTFWIGVVMTWFSYGYDAPRFILFLLGALVMSLGSIFTGYLSKD